MPKNATSEAIETYGLEHHVAELESDGLTILPPEVTGVSEALIDRCVAVLLDKFEALTGCPITVDEGPLKPLEWPVDGNIGFVNKKDAPPAPTQSLLQQLLKFDRCFRDLAVNPVVDALVDHMIGPAWRGGRARRLSSANSFLKWPGEFGYGPNLGLHADQASCPLPWSDVALNANATWALTDYTLAGGALAYVPGSHLRRDHPPEDAAKEAVPAEAPRGSCILFHGGTWHGAFPKQTPGLRITAVSYYRHVAVQPQELLSATMRDEPWQDCANPDLMRELLGLDDKMPYLEQSFPLPRASS